jgi:hypothetical protein
MHLSGSGNAAVENCYENGNQASCSVEVVRYLTGLHINIVHQEKPYPWDELGYVFSLLFVVSLRPYLSDSLFSLFWNINYFVSRKN